MTLSVPSRSAGRNAGAAAGLGANPGLGILLSLANGLLLVFNDTAAKLVLEHLPVGQFMVLRGIAATLLIFGWICLRGQLRLLTIHNWPAMALYAFCMAASTHAFLNALNLMPLGDATAITFASPIFTTAMAALILKEQVGWRRWTAVGIGFLGVLLLLAPTGQGYPLVVTLLPLSVAVFVSVRDIASRRLSATDASIAILFYNTAAVTLSGVVTVPFEPAWLMPSNLDLAYILGAALMLGLAQYCIVEAYRLAELSLIMPSRYASLVFAALGGYLVWHEVPTWNVALGAGVICASGLFIWYREQRRKAVA
ncbi:MAG TPA: DMT family transporter [Kiloniellales bacterium]|nr:DMT family transporter [Kiloniellales bacterium]